MEKYVILQAGARTRVEDINAILASPIGFRHALFDKAFETARGIM
jgi:hypothetical protein